MHKICWRFRDHKPLSENTINSICFFLTFVFSLTVFEFFIPVQHSIFFIPVQRYNIQIVYTGTTFTFFIPVQLSNFFPNIWNCYSFSQMNTPLVLYKRKRNKKSKSNALKSWVIHTYNSTQNKTFLRISSKCWLTPHFTKGINPALNYYQCQTTSLILSFVFFPLELNSCTFFKTPVLCHILYNPPLRAFLYRWHHSRKQQY